jgi:endonuclease IV
MLPGIHASANGGLVNALSTLQELGLVSGQIFTSNQKQWKGRPVTLEEEKEFGKDETLTIISHASYLINLASTRKSVPWLSAKALGEELIRMHRLGIHWLVMHPGAHLNAARLKTLPFFSRTPQGREQLWVTHSSSSINCSNSRICLTEQGSVLTHVMLSLPDTTFHPMTLS